MTLRNNKQRRRVAVFTGGRAEFDLQRPILESIQSDPRLELLLTVCSFDGSSSSQAFLDHVAASSLPVSETLQLNLAGNSVMTPLAIASVLDKYARFLDSMRPDMCLVYADRFETFGAALASTQMGIPTFHVEGGDVTEGGTFDDTVRDVISRLAHFHFPTSYESRERLLRMGEEEWRIRVVGSVVNDFVETNNFATPSELEASLGVSLEKPIVVFTLHPLSMDIKRTMRDAELSAAIISELLADGVQVVATAPNEDFGSDVISEMLSRFSSHVTGNFTYRANLGRYLFQGILSWAGSGLNRGICLGNSSAGLKETEAFGCPSVNLGSRQQGRLRGGNVLDLHEMSLSMARQQVARALRDEDFRRAALAAPKVYQGVGVGPTVVETMCNVGLDATLLRKKAPHARSSS